MLRYDIVLLKKIKYYIYQNIDTALQSPPLQKPSRKQALSSTRR